MRGADQRVSNVKVVGPSGATGNGGPLIKTDYPGTVRAVIEDVSGYGPATYGWDFVSGHDYTLRRWYAEHITDAYGIFNTSSPTAPANVEIYGGMATKFAKYYPDGGAHADGTHNDGGQIQQGAGGMRIYSNIFDGYFDPNWGNTGGLGVDNTGAPISPEMRTINAILQINMNVSGGVTRDIYFAYNYCYGSNFGVNASQSTLNGQNLGTFGPNRWDHGGYYPAGHSPTATNTYTINITSRVTADTAGNVYEDTGGPVTVRRPA
jgi:hypothetical protein